MKFSLEWIASYLPGPCPDPVKTRERLTSGGFIVEGQEGSEASTVYDVEITANRPDAMNHRGLAREAAVALDRLFADRESGEALAETQTPVDDLARVVIEEPTLCPRYSARVLQGIRIAPASAAVRKRLAAIGQSSISAPVDATNHVLWDIGQPLHAFDLDLLAKGSDGKPTIVVRRARAGETLVTLDGVTRTLGAEHLVIADAERPVALAGVMGGLPTSISDKTTRVLLESAHFAPQAVRLTSRSLGLHTDASHRFERGTDPEATIEGLDRAGRLIAADCGGAVARGVIDVREAQRPARSLVLRVPRLTRILGMEIAPARVQQILASLGFSPQREEDAVRVTVPPWRVDIESEIDLVEEIIRCEGYDRLPETLPRPYVPIHSDRHAQLEDRVRDLLVGSGLVETQTYSFVSERENAPFETAAPGAPATIENALGEPFTTLRATPVVGLLQVARYNMRHRMPDLSLFEVGRAFGRDGTSIRERACVALLLTGRRGVHWSQEPRTADFFDGSGAATALLSGLGIPAPRFSAAAVSFLAPGRSARIQAEDGAELGWVGVLVAPLAAAWDVAEAVVAELDLDRILERVPPPPSSVELPGRFPGSEADLTVTHRRLLLRWEELVRAVRRGAPPELQAVEAKYQYAGPGVPEGFVKTTLTLRFGSVDRSISREEVNAWRDAAARRLLDLEETKVDGVVAPEKGAS